MIRKKILIVGGTGFIGYHLSKACLKKNWKVDSLSLNFPKKNRYQKKINYILCDISNLSQIKKKIKDQYDYVINLGGHVDHKDTLKTKNSHYLGGKNLINFFEKKNIKLFVQIGSSAENSKIDSPQKETIFGKPVGAYGKSKLRVTKYLLKKKFNFVILRLYQIYGPEQDLNRFLPILINSVIKKKEFRCSSGVQFRDFLYIDDLINVFFKIFKNKNIIGKIINIGYGKPVQLKKIITQVQKVLGKTSVNFGQIKLRKDEDKIIYPDISLSKKLLEWKPRIPFKKGLSKTINYYVSKYNY